MTGQSIFKRLIPIPMILLLTGCGQPITPAARVLPQADSQATQAAHFVLTEIARPTRTPTPPPTLTPSLTLAPPSETPPVSASPAPSSMRVTPQPGLALYTHPDIPDYVFQIDPLLWEKDPGGETSNLFHKSIPGCRIDWVPGHGLGAPKRLFWEDFGRFRWRVMDYGVYAYAQPVQGAGLVDNQNSFLDLRGYNLRACRDAQEEVLANVMTHQEALGEVEKSIFRSPTPRPALEGFECPNTPPARLRIGDEVSIITDGLWLRTEPRADTSTKLRQFLRNAPFMVYVVGGPVCEKYVYWQVEVSEFGEDGGTIQGWLAEGDPQGYYIIPVK